MVTQFKFLNSNPVKGIQKASQIAAVPRFKLGLKFTWMVVKNYGPFLDPYDTTAPNI